MNYFNRAGRLKRYDSFSRRGRFERLEDRQLMAVVTGQSTFSASLLGDNIELMSDDAAVGYGYAINVDGQTLAAVGSGGQARTAADLPERSFSSLTEMEISSVSKTVTATAILQLLQSQPGGLDAALNTTLSSYLPSDWTPGANVQHVTLRHLLTHRSGFLEVGNSIGVNFNSYGQNNFQNLRNLVQAGLPAPTVAADNIYDTPRWNSSYNNANYSLLAKVVLPKLLNPAIDLTAANYANRDATSGAIYKQHVQDEVFEPMGIVGADLDVTDANPAKGYFLATAEDAPGLSQSNLTNTGGAFGWKLSARELATFLDAIRRDDGILWASTRQMRDQQELGWYQSEDAFGEFFTHNGSTSGGAGNFRSQIVAMPADVEVSYLMNSEVGNLPGASIGSMLKTAYVNAWSDLTVAGTSDPDEFVIRLDNSGFRPSIEVELNGVVEFTHWIDTLDSLTLNGQSGGDSFTILGWNASIDLEINGGFGNDVVSVLPGVRNIEWVNGMTFDGGWGDDSLLVNDQSNPYSQAALSRIYTVGVGGVVRYAGHPSFPGNPAHFIPVAIGFSDVENLDVTTGGQSDVVNVVSKTSGETNVRTGAGDDAIIVAQSAGNIETVDGLEVDGQTGLDTVRLFDHNKTSADPQATGQYDVDAESVSRYIASLGGIGSGGPAGVAVEFSRVENLELTTTDLVDVIRVHATPTGETTINGGGGGDVLSASPDGKNLELVGDLAFHGDGGLDSISFNDQNNPYSHPALSRVYSVAAAGVSRSAAMPGNPFAIPIPIDVAFSSVEELTLRTGGQTDVVNVASVPSAGAVIQTGLGNDVVNASPIAANFETVDGLQVDGGLGTDALNIHDENNPYELPGGAEYTITPATVGRFAEHVLFDNFVVPVELGFTAVENVSLIAGDQQDEFNVDGFGSDTTLVLDGNSGGDQFNVASPAFATINVQGDAPIFAPGDRLSVNEDEFYAVAAIPGLYPAGSGGVSIGATTIYYSGIEQADVQQPSYGPGDFDHNGLVDGEDLSDPALGWFARFGSDLAGQDFLVWQRHVGDGAPAVERGGGLTTVKEASTEELMAAAGVQSIASDPWFAGAAPADAASFDAANAEIVAVERNVSGERPNIGGGEFDALGARDAGFELFEVSADLLDGDAMAAVADWDRDAALAELGSALGAGV